MVNTNQRVGVFIDVQNIFYSAKHLHQSKVNYGAILKKAVNGRELIRAICYVITTEEGMEKGFHDALEKIGYEIRSKELQIFYGGAKKGDWDVGIAMDIMRMASKLDVVVLVSGDGDFQDLLEHVKALGCKAEVVAFSRAASSRIKAAADEFYDLGENPKQFLIPARYPPRPAARPAATDGKPAPRPVARPAASDGKPAPRPVARPAASDGKPAPRPVARPTATDGKPAPRPVAKPAVKAKPAAKTTKKKVVKKEK